MSQALLQGPSLFGYAGPYAAVLEEGLSTAPQNLSLHPTVLRAGLAALRECGLSPSVLPAGTLSWELEEVLAETLQTEHVALFSSSWNAAHAAIGGLLSAADAVVIDHLAHAGLMYASRAATPNHYPFRHNDLEALEQLLGGLRRENAENTILVVSEAWFATVDDGPDIAALQALCHRFGAVLLLDVSQDFGASGPGGIGQLGLQEMLGRVDLVLGCFSRTFASAGGFLATHELAVKERLERLEDNGLSPVQTAVILEALRLVRGLEGMALRERAARTRLHA
jgi:7-keto-8-aminopelargonate synthetase-like enzyme